MYDLTKANKVIARINEQNPKVGDSFDRDGKKILPLIYVGGAAGSDRFMDLVFEVVK